jgi:hypothetical protein
VRGSIASVRFGAKSSESHPRSRGEAMSEINVLTIVVSVLATFVMSTVWYIVFAKRRLRLSEAAPNMNSRNLLRCWSN